MAYVLQLVVGLLVTVAPFSGALLRSNPCMLGMTRGLRMARVVSVLVEFVVLSSFVIV